VSQKTSPTSYPTQGILHFMYGEIYRAEGNFNYANIEYRRALEYDTTATILNAIGESYIIMGKPQLATGYFEKTLKLDPQDETAQYHILELYMKELRYEEAIPIIQSQLKKNPEDLEMLQRVSECYRNIHDYERALETLDMMIKLNPDHPWPYVYSAEIMLEKNEIAKAAPYLEKIARVVTPNDGLYEFWVRSLFENNDISGMLSALEFWLDQKPENLAPYFLYIDYQFRLENFEAGNRILSDIADRWKEDSRISYFQGISAMARDDVDEVWTCFVRADQFPDPGVDLYLYYGLWFWEQGYLEEAETVADHAIAKLGPGTRWLHMKAMISAQWGEYEKAEHLLLAVIKADSTNLNAREDLANIYVEMNEAEKADGLYAELLKNLPDNASILNNYAYALSRLNIDLDRAMKMVNKALKKEKSAAYSDTKAWILYGQKKYNQALKWVSTALKLPDAGADVLYHQGRIFEKLNKIEEAKAAYNKSILIDPNNPEALRALEELK
jgi:tetratricopeptide (TPR) repeat protein